MGYMYVLYDGDHNDEVKRFANIVERRPVRYEFVSHSGDEVHLDRIINSKAVIVLVTEKLLKSRYALTELQFAVSNNKKILLVYIDSCRLTPPLDMMLKDATSISIDKFNSKNTVSLILSMHEMTRRSKDEIEDITLDALAEKVMAYAIESGQISVSAVQRRFSIGYARAAHIVDQLEERGYIGPLRSVGKSRDVLMTAAEYKTVFGRDLEIENKTEPIDGIIDGTDSPQKATESEPSNERHIKIGVVGVGGAGGNILNSIIESGADNLLCIAVNTDRSALCACKAHKCLQIGENVTKGYGAGADPQKGKLSAQNCRETIASVLKPMDLIFIVAGMGAGTGTGATPVIAEIARSMGKTVAAFVTMPFDFEGQMRNRSAEVGLNELKRFADTVIAVENEKLARIHSDMTTEQAFAYVNNVIKNGINVISEVASNHAYSEVCKILNNGGDGVVVTGSARGDDRVERAVRDAVGQDLFRIDVAVGARRAIVYTVGNDVVTDEAAQALELVRGMCADNAEIVFGCNIHVNTDEFSITIIATDFE